MAMIAQGASISNFNKPFEIEQTFPKPFWR